MRAKIRTSPVSVRRLGVIEGSQGLLHREQVSYAICRACCVVQDEDKGVFCLFVCSFVFLLRGMREGHAYLRKGCSLLLWRDAP